MQISGYTSLIFNQSARKLLNGGGHAFPGERDGRGWNVERRVKKTIKKHSEQGDSDAGEVGWTT